MATVSGSLVFVSSRAAQVSEVWLHAREVRTHDSGVVTTGNDRFPVEDGQVSFTALPGPAVLALISQGRAVDTIPIVVGESEAQSLRHVVRAAQIVDDSTSREIERLSAEMMEALDSAREEATAAQGHAKTAEGHATKAGEQVSLARGHAEAASASADMAREQASQAEGHASRAQSSAEESSRSADRAEGARSEARAAWDGAKEARDAAEGHASTSEGHAGRAEEHAAAAESSAGRAESSAQQVREIAESTRWDGDQVTVNGKQSPHLTGPRGPQGPPGRAENINLDQYARLDDLSDKVSRSELDMRFKTHRVRTTHYLSDKSEIGTPIATGNNGFLVVKGRILMGEGAEISMNDPSNISALNPPKNRYNVTNKQYVDKEISAVRDRVGALESRIQLVTALPDNPDPQTLYLVGE